MKRQEPQPGPAIKELPTRASKAIPGVWAGLCAAALMALASVSLHAQAANPRPAGEATAMQTPTASPAATQTEVPLAKTTPVIPNKDRRRAAKLFLEATKLFDNGQFEEAMQSYQKAVELDPTNSDYALAAEVARSHAVSALVQKAAKDRIRGDAASARQALGRALELDPKNALVNQHLYELSDDALTGQTAPLYRKGADIVGGETVLAPVEGTHSFHLHTDERSTIQQVFRAFGLEATVDASVATGPIRLDMDNASFSQAAHTLSMLTNSFFVPLDAHRVIVAKDTKEYRQQFVRQEMETIYLPGLSQTELTDVGNLAKNLFDASQSVVEQSTGTLTIRAPQPTLTAFNSTVRDLMDGHSQVLLEVRLIQLARLNERKTGAQLQQQMSVFNVYAEARNILNANQALVQQIIASGLASPTDYLTIIAILLASGQVSSPLLSSGFATFGGGAVSTFGFSPGPITMNLNLNSSDSRELDQLQLRLGDGEAGTLRFGTRYPIQTSSYSIGSGSGVNIPGLTGAGSSSALSSLLTSINTVPPIPQVEYQDLGMTLKTTPKVMRDADVALTIELKITALGGQFINGNPVLNNRAYSGVVTLREGESVVVVSEINKQESRAISGTPGLSEIPGLNNLTSKDNTLSYSTLLMVITPHVIRGTQTAGHSPMMRVETNPPTR